MSSPPDHFSALATDYAAFRPTYPEALFDWLAEIAPGHSLAWDCGAGSGQATLPLTQRFEQVWASDLSHSQLKSLPPRANLTCHVAPAHESGLSPQSADLITVAQALHWFDLDRFYGEVRRVLRPHGVIAVWGYNRLRFGHPEIQSRLDHFYEHKIGHYWPAERVHVENGYRDLPFPFTRIFTPAYDMQQQWRLPQLLGYLRSWSAIGHYRAATGVDPVDAFGAEIEELWPEGQTLEVSWPLFLHVGRIS